MAYPCKSCNKAFTTKANQERHEKTAKHLICVACLETQPKITDFFALEAKIAAQDVAISRLSDKVAVLEATTATLTKQVTALVQANVQLVHAAEIAELKLAHALELAARTDFAQAKPRHTGAENHQINIEKWFDHKRKYGETMDADTNEVKISGFRDLAVKIRNLYMAHPDLPAGDNFSRLLKIYKDEVDSQKDNKNGIQTAFMTLWHPVFKWSTEDGKYLKFSFSFESPNHLARHDMTEADSTLKPTASRGAALAPAQTRLLAEKKALEEEIAQIKPNKLAEFESICAAAVKRCRSNYFEDAEYVERLERDDPAELVEEISHIRRKWKKCAEVVMAEKDDPNLVQRLDDIKQQIK